MQLSLAFVLCSAVIGIATSSPLSVPILSHLSDAPFPSRPSGQLFRLPLRQQKQKQEVQPNLYYGVPPQVLPDTTEVAEELTTTTEMPTTTEVTLDQLKQQEKQEKNEDAEKFDQEGVYYIYHPDGLLQRVVYGTKVEDMGYTARLTYKDVQPIKEPIYTYDPQTLVFSKIEF